MSKFFIHIEFETNFNILKVFLEFIELLGVSFGGFSSGTKICGFCIVSKENTKSANKIQEYIILWCQEHRIKRLCMSPIFEKDLDYKCSICHL